MSWKQATWYVFHMLALNYDENKKEHYKLFFESFKHLLPCQICHKHYNSQLLRPNLIIDDFILEGKIFDWTIKIHNNVNSSNGKKIWMIDEAKNFYKKKIFDPQIIKLMILEYVKYNFKKGPEKTEALFKMLNNLYHIYPIIEKREKLLNMNIPLNRERMREWLVTSLKIICEK